MKRFRSVGSDKCSMLLTDFKADAQSCGNTGVFREGSITEEEGIYTVMKWTTLIVLASSMIQ